MRSVIFFKLLAENSSASTELDLNQRHKHFLEILISYYSPPLYQLSYRWNLSDKDPSTEMNLLPYKISYFLEWSVENSTVSTEKNLNQRAKDYWQIFISHYSPSLYQLRYQWNLSYADAGTEIKLLPYKICYFLKLLAENSAASTEPDLNQRPKDYCQILISHYSPPLYQLSYQWNLSYEDASTEMKLLPYKICYFFKNCLQKTVVHPLSRI